jgi:hypothetical protein
MHWRKIIRYLCADLHAVASIDKDPRHLWQNGAEAGRTGKSRQPFKAGIARSDIFTLMRVGTGNQKGVKTACSHFSTQGFQARRALIGRRLCLERLKQMKTP